MDDDLICTEGVRAPPVWAFLILGLVILSQSALLHIAKVPVLDGVWKDVDTDYYVIFDSENQMYRESFYGIERPYRQTDKGVVLTDVSGLQTFMPIKRNIRGTVDLTLYGAHRVLKPCDITPTTEALGVVMSSGECTEVYTSKVQYDPRVSLRLYSNYSFAFSNLGTEISGKYARRTTNGVDELLLFISGEEHPEVLHPCSLGFVCGELESSLTAETVRANPLEDRGVLLSGFVLLPESGVAYQFYDDNTAVKEYSTGESVDLLYFVDNEGLITMSDTLGVNSKDYLWFDKQTSAVYRYIFERDDWYDFLSSGGSSS